MTETKIQWTNFSANPIKYRDADGKVVWACAKVSDGCKNCYSEAIAHRYKRGGPFTLQQLRTTTPYFDEVEAGKILRSKKLAGKRVFIGDMTDVFGDWVPFEMLDKLFAMFALRPDVTFQVLTKRPERMAEWCASQDGGFNFLNAYKAMCVRLGREDYRSGISWPLPNVWLGTSCENQKTANERIPHLLQCAAAVRFLSAEPLLEPIDLLQIKAGALCPDPEHRIDVLRGGTWNLGLGFTGHSDIPGTVQWVIVGGESGHGARPCGVHWVRSIIKQCQAAGVPVFNKQLGSNCRMELTGGECGDRIKLRSSKGGDIDEWVSDLRVREMPREAVGHLIG